MKRRDFVLGAAAGAGTTTAALLSGCTDSGEAEKLQKELDTAKAKIAELESTAAAAPAAPAVSKDDRPFRNRECDSQPSCFPFSRQYSLQEHGTNLSK